MGKPQLLDPASVSIPIKWRHIMPEEAGRAGSLLRILWAKGHENPPTTVYNKNCNRCLTESSPCSSLNAPADTFNLHAKQRKILKHFFWKRSWLCREGEASDEGTFSNDGVNLSLGSLQLHLSSATNSLCDAGYATQPLRSCVYRRANSSLSHRECEDGSVTKTASEISCRWGRVTSGGKKNQALACPHIAAALQQLLMEMSSRAWCHPLCPFVMLRQAPRPHSCKPRAARGFISATLWWTGFFWCTAVFFLIPQNI